MIYKILINILIGLFLNSIVIAKDNMIYDFKEASVLSQETKMPILLIFGADWCPHCKSLKQDITDDDFGDLLDKYILCYIDVDDNRELKNEFRIKSLPDSRILKSGVEKYSMIGYDHNRYKTWILNAK